MGAGLGHAPFDEQEFGKCAVGDGGFVANLREGDAPTMDTADRLLRFLGEAPIGHVFRREVEAFLDFTAVRPTRLGTKAAGFPWFVGAPEEGVSARLSAVQRVRACMVEAVTPSQRAVIAGMLEDSGSTTFNDGASTFMQGERRERATSPASDAEKGRPRPCSQGSPPVVSRYDSSSEVSRAYHAHAGALPIGRQGPRLLQAWVSGVLCACRSADLGAEPACEYRLTGAGA